MLLNDNQNQTFHRIFAKKLLHEWLVDKEDTKWDGDGYLLDFTLIEKLSNNGRSVDIVSYNNCYLIPELFGYGFNPSPDTCISNGDEPIMIADIAKVYKGTLREIFIVYDKSLDSNINDELMKFIYLNEYAKGNMKFAKRCIALYAISEKLILKQTKKPTNIYDLCRKINIKKYKESNQDVDVNYV
tara:strand:+ start:8517 stop:9074 length:558 start_codon:yes stop_codon:yes gene_type:complete